MTAQDKLEQTIERGRINVHQVLGEIQHEFEVRQDYIVKPNVIDFVLDDTTCNLRVAVDASTMYGEFTTTTHSESQVFGRANIPITFAQRLKVDEPNLLKTNLQTLTPIYCKRGILVRQVAGCIKGYLSPSYKRMDASPIFESFVKTALRENYQPFRATNTTYRYHIGFVLPQVYVISDNDALAFGIGITTSDYGAKALQIDMFTLRIWCSNLAVGYDLLRKVHLGQRFSISEQDDAIYLSQRTNMLDTETIASAVSDVVKSSREQVATFLAQVQIADSRALTSKEAMMRLKATPLLKGETNKVMQYFDSQLPVEALPQTKSLWRLSSAISLLAKESDDSDKMLDIEKVAYSVITKV